MAKPFYDILMEMEDAPIVRVVNSIIDQAAKNRASDIHIEPEETRVRIRFRIDGILREITGLPKTSSNSVVSRIKIISGMDIAEKRIPQDGRFRYTINGFEVDVRVSTFPTIHGEKVVLRLLDKKPQLIGFEDLGFSKEVQVNIKRLLKKSYGMTLITGPTGSGKTTTLYALLNEINSTETNIVTLEDPVEYLIEGINQTSVNPPAGLTFPTGLRSILRQDPDNIMVGEIRDLETAQIAISAANTGHLLLSTLHTNNSASALTRLVEMGIEPYLVASSVNGILNQRLVRKICINCMSEWRLPKHSPERKLLKMAENEDSVVYKGMGCELCGGTGFFGRIAIGEVLVVSEPIRKMLLGKESSTTMMAYLTENDSYRTILDDGIIKIREGVTTIGEIERCI